MNTNHKYPIGELVMHRVAFDQNKKNVFGVITAYEDRYYIVSWYNSVPKQYTGVFSEDEISRMCSNLTREMEK